VKRIWLAVFLCAGLAGPAWAEDFTAMSPAQFALLPALGRRIDSGPFDRALLAAAIFHETNRVRLVLKLRALKPLPQLERAADLQADVGVVLRLPSHENPFPSIATPIDRVKFVGLQPGFVAENIARLPAYDFDNAGGEAGVKTVGQQRTIINLRTGEELVSATYRAMAARLVEAWMKSPGHRANIVSPLAQYLGCSARATQGDQGADMIFAVQVFFAPRG
jgi:uncharacterized protein YkwD